jgi:hypothetical protein
LGEGGLFLTAFEGPFPVFAPKGWGRSLYFFFFGIFKKRKKRSGDRYNGVADAAFPPFFSKKTPP